MAAFALVSGFMQIAFAVELRRAVGELDHTFRPRSTAKPVTQLRKEKDEMNMTQPALVTAVIVMCFGALMVQAGIAKRQLAWRPRRAKHQTRRRP